jgi:hypothetical protein
MSEKLVGNIEDRHEDEASHEVFATPEAPTEQEHFKQEAEIRAKHDAEKNARKEIEKAHESAKGTLNQSARFGARTIRVPLHKLEPVVDTVAKTWGSIRQNLSPTQKTFSKVIHNPVVRNVSEFTAKTLARPYAILSGGVVAVVGSAIYLYFTRHLSYKYNFFVPILLFLAGLAVGIIVEMVYKLVAKPHKR